MHFLKSLDQITSADGFTQASVESRQMSSTGGTTEVSTKGTAITATEPVTGDETVMQMGQGMWMILMTLQKEKNIYTYNEKDVGGAVEVKDGDYGKPQYNRILVGNQL